MIQISATAESVVQAKDLLAAGVTNLLIGDEIYALRVPEPLKLAEIRRITALVHQASKSVTVAVNALMHADRMATIKAYLDFLQEIRVDKITVGDAGVIYVLQRDHYRLPYSYDASTLLTSARQVNFWAAQGAVEAVLARELPKPELEAMAPQLAIPAEVLVYGATVIHHSKRPLLQNYLNFAKIQAGKGREANHFIAEPKAADTHYSIFEDAQGTHVFANDDINMMTVLGELTQMGYTHWKLDGIFTRGTVFTEIVKYFAEAKELIEEGRFTMTEAFRLDEEVRRLHPTGRALSHGFYEIDPAKIK